MASRDKRGGLQQPAYAREDKTIKGKKGRRKDGGEGDASDS